MSNRKIITFEQFAINCKHKIAGCELHTGYPFSCNPDKCPILVRLPDVEPIIEAAKIYWHENTSKLNRLDELRDALFAVKEGGSRV